jgi:hypothetical protein
LKRLVDEAGEYALQMGILRGQSLVEARKRLWGRLPVNDVVLLLMAPAARPSGQGMSETDGVPGRAAHTGT